MPGVKIYPWEYIYACRSRVDADVASYHHLVSATPKSLSAAA